MLFGYHFSTSKCNDNLNKLYIKVLFTFFQLKKGDIDNYNDNDNDKKNDPGA